MCYLIKFNIICTLSICVLLVLCNICTGNPREKYRVRGFEDVSSKASSDDGVLQSRGDQNYSPPRAKLKGSKTRVKLKRIVVDDNLSGSRNTSKSRHSSPPPTSGPGRTSDYDKNDALGPARDFWRHSIVVPKLLHSRTKRELFRTEEKDGHAPHVSLGLTIEDEDFVFDLQLNRDLLTKDYFEKQLKNGSHTIRRPGPKESNMCHYQGFIKERPGSWAALSTCEGVRGVVFDGDELHYLEPMPGPATASVSSLHYLMSHKDLRANNLTCGYTGDPHPVTDLFHDKHFERLLRFKRDTTVGRLRGPFNANVLSRYVELILVADRAEYDKHNSDIDKIYRRCKDIVNIVNALYQPLNIFIALVGVEVWQDEDPVEISTDGDKTLTNFLNYRKVRLIPDHPNDNAQLLTGKMFDSGVVGKALKGPICTYQYSGGVNMDHSDSVGLVATTVAHEMGHNFGMEHDTEEDCKCPDKRCIMAPSSGTKSPSHWSSCSHEYLAISFERSMDYCLRNKPTSLFESPVCGNGFVEPGEQCDCGLPKHCINPCCNASSCMLFTNATCATGHCCNLETCRPKDSGTECRGAIHECDLAEYCSGDSEYCPENFYKEDGHNCLGGKAYCYEGRCRTHEHQCRLLWGPTGKNSHDKCYQLNKEGNTNGNCGYNWANKSYKGCNTNDIKCGMMHCKHFNERLEFGMESVSKVSHRFIADTKEGVIPCRVAQVDLGLDMVDPGLAPDGAKCGYKRMCVNQRCMEVASLRIHSCDCHSEGVCNNMGNCHCNVGFGFPDCKYPGLGGSIDSGPASNPHTTSRFVLGLFLMFAGVFLVIMVILCILYYSRGNLTLLWIRKGRPVTSRFSGLDNRTQRSSAFIETGRSKQKSNEVTAGVGQSSPQSSQGSKTNSPLLNGHLNGTQGTTKLIGKYEGFTLAPIKDDPAINGGHTSQWKTTPLPTNVWPPTKSSSIDISGPSLQALTNPAAVHSSTTVMRKAPLPPTTVPPVSILTPTRKAPSRPKSVPDASVLLNNNETFSVEFETGEKDQGKASAVTRITSYLTKKDGSNSPSPSRKDVSQPGQCNNTLPRKATKINRESLLQLEISNPMQLHATELPSNLVPVRSAPQPPPIPGSPEKIPTNKVSWATSVSDPPSSPELLRIGSVREPKVSTRPFIPKFGSMRTPRPKSLPPARPSQPPPRPPLPMIPGTPESDYTYDDCVNFCSEKDGALATSGQSPQEEIYETIDEESPPSSKEDKKKSIFSMLYAKANKIKKKKVPDAPLEPVYCNIEKNPRETTPDTPPPVMASAMGNSSLRGSVEDNGLLSEIVTELANREPQYVNTLPANSLGKFSPIKNTTKTIQPISTTDHSSNEPLIVDKISDKKFKESKSSPELSDVTSSSSSPKTVLAGATPPYYSNVQPRGVFSFLKSASADEPSSPMEVKSSIVSSCEKTKVNPSASVPNSLATSLASVKAASQETKKTVIKSKTDSKLNKSSIGSPPPPPPPSTEDKKLTKIATAARPAFPPDKIMFPPDKISSSNPSVEIKASASGKAVASSVKGRNVNAALPKVDSSKTSTKSAKLATSPNDSKPSKVVLSPKEAKAGSSTVVEKPRPLASKKPTIVSKVDSGNRGRNSLVKSISHKYPKTDPNVPKTSKSESDFQKDAADEKQVGKETFSLKDSAKKKSNLSKPTSRSSTSRVMAAAAKPKGSSHVASLQQKFESPKPAD